MKIALCTTTIHVPHALKLMRKCSADVRFFVALDENTPEDAGNFCTYDMDGTVRVIYLCEQKKWKCSEAIGWNCIQRRNIAFLEAIRWGADAIYSWDTDNVPISTAHFSDIEATFDSAFSGIKVTGDKGWFDSGQLLIPAVRQRGFPHNKPPSKQASHVVDAKIGVVAGLVLGDSDIDAVTRIEKAPDVSQVHILGSTGVVVDPNTWTVFNSQNSAVIRELAPAWFLMPGTGRHDDIYASLIVQRVARERGYHVHFGPPHVYQQRHKHDLVADLRAELDGMENVQKLAKFLDAVVLPAKWSVSHDVRIIYNQLAHADFIPRPAVDAALAWLDDCEGLGL